MSVLEGQLFKLFSAVSVQNEEARLMSELFSLLLHQLLHSYLSPHGGQWPWWSSSPSTPCLSCTVSPPTLCDWTRRPLLLRLLWLDSQQNLWGGETYKSKQANDIKTYAAKQRKFDLVLVGIPGLRSRHGRTMVSGCTGVAQIAQQRN